MHCLGRKFSFDNSEFIKFSSLFNPGPGFRTVVSPTTEQGSDPFSLLPMHQPPGTTIPRSLDNRLASTLSNTGSSLWNFLAKGVLLSTILCMSSSDRSGVKRVRNHRRASIRHQIRLHNHIHIAKFQEQRMIPHETQQIQPLLGRGLEVQMHEVAIARVVESQERPLERVAVAAGARYEIGETRRGREGRDGYRMELGFHKHGVRSGHGTIDWEEIDRAVG
ncbi:Beta-glucuronosyltransferase GlcAT14A [Senna tora]|uniref:Beta-glucuronosyltransferase GlcAT14A n=1 Tax=Senna tora TaxID=362788 RepID=A0A834SIE7_9FABA|nr:Beta-glucuronosyltransferase GlcAT14A [Senna tora]